LESTALELSGLFWVLLGGFVAVHFMSDASNVDINPKTIAQLAQLGIEALMGN
jgi:hypothetical protein